MKRDPFVTIISIFSFSVVSSVIYSTSQAVGEHFFLF